jgi:DNA-binding transcriptional LysR family regulator
MDTALVRTFVDVMRRGSFASVARDREVDPSSISRSIAALEEQLGIRLFQRTTRRLSPTEAGMVYFDRIEPLIEEIERAHHLAADVGQRPSGVLRVTTSVSFGQECIVPLLPDFTSAHPELSLELLLSDAVIDIVAERVDVAIRLGVLADSSLVATQLLQTSYSVCASPDYIARRGLPKTPRDIEQHECLLFLLPGFRTRWIFRDKQGELTEVPVAGRVTISNAAALRQCAVAGMGLALLPQWNIGADLLSGKLVTLFANYDVTATDFKSAAWLLYPSRSYMPLKVRAFGDYLKREFRARPPWLRRT